MFDPATALAIALKTCVLIAAVGLLAFLTAKRSAAWRHFLWTSALALSLLLPIAVVSLPSSLQISLPWQSAEPRVRDETVLLTAGARRAEAAGVIAAPRVKEAASVPRSSPAAWPTALIVWLVGASIVLLRNALAHAGLIRWARQARPGLSLAWAGTLRRVTGEAGFGRRLRVLESDRTTSPCTWGIVRPVVLLPAAGADWPESQRRFALLHELAHVRRFDYATTQLASLACAMHWYNPLVWFAAVQARKLQEQACDDVVLNAGGMPSDYAEFLVGIAGGARRLSLASPAAVGMVQRSQLHGRVTAILDASKARPSLSGAASLVALVPLACLMLVLAAVSAAASPLVLERGVPLSASFSSVELRNGGTVTLVRGPSPRVTLLEGDPEEIAIRIGDGRLVIDRCPGPCSHGHDLEVEVETPGLAAIAVAEGGTIQSRGDFPHSSEIDLAVSQGGTIDVRSMAVTDVTASVYSGGRILVKPAGLLTAQVEQGGNVTYWGDALVHHSIRYGGVVVEGTAADADRSLAELLGPQYVAPVPPTPPVPPLPATP